MSIGQETRPRQEYIDYAEHILTSSETHGRSSFPESPLNCPSGVFRTLIQSKACSANILEVINMVRDLTQVVLDLRKWSTLFGPAPEALDISVLDTRKQSLIFRLLNLLPNPGDAYYEAIRLCAVLYANAIYYNTSFSEAAKSMGMAEFNGGIVASIREQLMRTDLSTCWGRMVGVLFWIILVSSAACNRRSRLPAR